MSIKSLELCEDLLISFERFRGRQRVDVRVAGDGLGHEGGLERARLQRRNVQLLKVLVLQDVTSRSCLHAHAPEPKDVIIITITMCVIIMLIILGINQFTSVHFTSHQVHSL